MATFRYIVEEVSAAVAFYVGNFGFELIEQYGPAMAIVQRGDLQLWLAGPSSSAAKAMPDGRKPVGGGWNRAVIVVENLDSLVAQLRTGGATFRNDIVHGPGGRQILLDDPSGNCVELFEPAK
jgi:predicted enzyme related to lactoylglutathione lyase